MPPWSSGIDRNDIAAAGAASPRRGLQRAKAPVWAEIRFWGWALSNRPVRGLDIRPWSYAFVRRDKTEGRPRKTMAGPHHRFEGTPPDVAGFHSSTLRVQFSSIRLRRPCKGIDPVIFRSKNWKPGSPKFVRCAELFDKNNKFRKPIEDPLCALPTDRPLEGGRRFFRRLHRSGLAHRRHPGLRPRRPGPFGGPRGVIAFRMGGRSRCRDGIFVARRGGPSPRHGLAFLGGG